MFAQSGVVSTRPLLLSSLAFHLISVSSSLHSMVLEHTSDHPLGLLRLFQSLNPSSPRSSIELHAAVVLLFGLLLTLYSLSRSLLALPPRRSLPLGLLSLSLSVILGPWGLGWLHPLLGLDVRQALAVAYFAAAVLFATQAVTTGAPGVMCMMVLGNVAAKGHGLDVAKIYK